MSGRLCGYCRDAGHQRPKCPKLHKQRKELRDHVFEQTVSIYNFLCRIGLGPNALINANALKWGRSNAPPLLAQILPYDYDVTRRYYTGDTYKVSYASELQNGLFRIKNVKYSKAVSVHHLHYMSNSVYAHIPILLLDGSNSIELISVPTLSLYCASISNANPYAAGEGREIMEKLFVSPCNDCPPLVVPPEILGMDEHFYPERLRL